MNKLSNGDFSTECLLGSCGLMLVHSIKSSDMAQSSFRVAI